MGKKYLKVFEDKLWFILGLGAGLGLFRKKLSNRFCNEISICLHSPDVQREASKHQICRIMQTMVYHQHLPLKCKPMQTQSV